MFLRFFVFISIFCISSSAYSITSYDAESKAPIIVYFKGTCSAGKSTLIQSIRGKWEDLEIVDEDSIVHRIFPEAVACKFPIEYNCIIKAIAEQNLYHALRQNDVLFKRTATQEECLEAKTALKNIQKSLNQTQNLAWKEEVKAGIRRDLIETIRLALQNEKNVLLDSWYFTANQIQELFPETPVIRVMLYCSFPIAYERLLKRNNEALAHENLQEKRFVDQLMSTFCSLYQLSDQPSQLIENINRQELDDLFNSIYLTLEDENINKQKLPFTFGELSRSEFQKLQTEFMQPFVDLKATNLYITPKEKQDLILDNTAGDVQIALDSLKILFNS